MSQYTFLRYKTKLCVINLLSVGSCAMGIHLYFFIFLFLIVAVATEDVQVSMQGRVLISIIHMGDSRIMAMTLELLLTCAAQPLARQTQFVCLVMGFFKMKTDPLFKSKIFMYVSKPVSPEHFHCIVILTFALISIFLYISSSIEGFGLQRSQIAPRKRMF